MWPRRTDHCLRGLRRRRHGVVRVSISRVLESHRMTFQRNPQCPTNRISPGRFTLSMNPLSPELVTGTVGELLVQLRLLQFDVQAAPPIKDSGNDLIAVRRSVFRALQIKTTAGESNPVQNLPGYYHILAVVHLVGDGRDLWLDRSRVFLIPKERIETAPRQINALQEFALTQAHIDVLFRPRRLATTELAT